MATHEPLTLALLAGGKSRRMGFPKQLLPVAGGTLIEWLCARLAPKFDELLVCASRETLPPALWPNSIPDLRIDAGPLAGIEAALVAASHQATFVLACDMPLVRWPTVLRLLHLSRGHGAAATRIGDLPQPLCAVYRKSVLPSLQHHLETGRRGAVEFLLSLDVVYLEDLEDLELSNINTPAALEALRAHLR